MPRRSILRVLGTFDEESCRFFLRETGEAIVPYFPFSIGIENVYGLLLERYGLGEIADATSVLHELLEDQTSATGIGDDGDVWRSWRHQWRHRNDNPLDPSAPRVDGQLLPPPTSRRTRLIKGANFVALQAKRPSQADEAALRPTLSAKRPKVQFLEPNTFSPADPPNKLDELENLPGTAGSPKTSACAQNSEGEALAIERDSRRHHAQRQIASEISVIHNLHAKRAGGYRERGLNLATEGTIADDSDSEQDFDEISPTTSPDSDDDPFVISFVMMQPRRHSIRRSKGLRGGEGETCTLRQVYRKSTGLETGDDLPNNKRTVCFSNTEGRISNLETGFGHEFNDHSRLKCETNYLDNQNSLWKSANGLVADEVRVDSVADSPHHGMYSDRDELPARPEGTKGNGSALCPQPGRDCQGQHKEQKSCETRMQLRSSPKRHEKSDSDLGHGQPEHQTVSCVPLGKAHRQVSLVDGHLVTPPYYQQEFGKAILNDTASSSRRSSQRSSWNGTGTAQIQPLRHSWADKFRSLFQKDHHNKHCSSTSTTASTLASPTNVVQSSFENHVSRASVQPNSSHYCFGLDGSFDVRLYEAPFENSSHTMTGSRSPVNLHKALPPPPGSLSASTPTSGTTVTSSSSRPHNTTFHSRASSASSLGISSKKDFKYITRGLIHPGCKDLSALSPVQDPAMSLEPAKFDPLRSPPPPKSPVSFTSFADANPFSISPRSPRHHMPPPLSLRNRDPVKMLNSPGLPHSHSEPSMHGIDTNNHPGPAEYYIPVQLRNSPPRKAGGSKDRDDGRGRGGAIQRPESPDRTLQAVDEEKVLDTRMSPRKRSRSPVKRMLGIGKSTSCKDIAGEPQNDDQAQEDLAERTKKAGLKIWGDRLKHGFLTTDSKPASNTSVGLVTSRSSSQQSRSLVSLDPPYQAKTQSEVELMICITANNYLLHEHHAGRLSAESVSRIRRDWAHKNRPQVIQFQYDIGTQRDLVVANIGAVKLHGESGESALVLNATLYSWKVMAKEMSVRTFCVPDSVMRKHLHDAHKILEMLGAPLVTFLAFQELQLKALSKITDKVRQKGETRLDVSRTRQNSEAQTPSSTQTMHSRKTSKGTYESSEGPTAHSRKTSNEEKMWVKDTCENSRGGRLGLMMKQRDRSA